MEYTVRGAGNVGLKSGTTGLEGLHCYCWDLGQALVLQHPQLYPGKLVKY